MYEFAKGKNFRGISRFEIPFKGIQIVAGDNGTGKSSIAMAIGAALTGNVTPIVGMTKTNSGRLVKRGSQKATIRLEGKAGYSEISWPDPKLATMGPVQACSKVAARLTVISKLSIDERTKFFTELLKAEPTEKDFIEECKDAEISAEDAGAYWNDVIELNWEGAYSKHKETGAKLKGQWEAVTGTGFGTDKMKKWFPENYPEVDIKELEKRSSELKQAYAQAVKDVAIFDTNLDELRAKAAETEKIFEEIELLKEEILSADTEIKRADEARAKINTPNELRDKHKCPNCGIPLVLIDGELHKPTSKQATKEELAQVKVTLDKAIGRCEAAREVLAKLRESMAVLNAKANYGLKAKEQLLAIEAQGVPKTRPDADKIADELNTVQLAIFAYESKVKADNLAKLISDKITLVKLLDVKGLRKTVLAKAMQAFRGELAALCTLANQKKNAKWPTISITDDMQLTMDDLPWELLCTSEQWKVDTTLQIAIAIKDKSRYLIIDEAALLMKGGKNGLFVLLRKANVDTLIFLSVPDKETAAEFAQKIPTYFIEDESRTAELIQGVA